MLKNHKIKKRTANIGFRCEETFKQKVLKYCYDNNISQTEVFEEAFDLYVQHKLLEEKDQEN